MDLPPFLQVQNLSAQASGAGGNHTLTRVPQAVLNLPVGTVVSGTVTVNPTGATTLATPHGNMTINTPFPIQSGNELSFRIVSTNPMFQAQLISVSNNSTTQGREANTLTHTQGNSAAAPQQSGIVGQYKGIDQLIFRAIVPSQQGSENNASSNRHPISTAATVPQNLTNPTVMLQTTMVSVQGDALAALFAQAITKGHIPEKHNMIQTRVPNQPGSVASVPDAARVTAGSTILLRMMIPTASKEGTPSTPTTNAPSTGGQTAVQGNTQAPTQQAGSFSAALGGQATNTSVPQTQAGAPQGQATSPFMVSAEIIGKEKSGETILKLPFGTVKLPAHFSLPPDTKSIMVELTSIIVPQSTQTTASSSTSNKGASQGIVSQLLQHWGTLEQIVTGLKQDSSGSVEKLLQQVIPNAGKELGAQLLHFTSAVRDANVAMWLGPQIMRTLKDSGKEALLDRLVSDFKTMRAMYTEPSAKEDWQALPFPLFDGEEIHQVQIYVRDYNQEGTAEQEAMKGTRFIVEVDTTAFGPMQLDGLVRQGSENQTFDLIIRNTEELPADNKEDILDIYAQMQEITGFNGTLLFQTTPEFPFKPADDVIESAPIPPTHDSDDLIV